MADDDDRVSLAPLGFRDALKGLLAVKRDEDTEQDADGTEDAEDSDRSE